MERELFWVIGQRIDDRFKIKTMTGLFWKITISRLTGASAEVAHENVHISDETSRRWSHNTYRPKW